MVESTPDEHVVEPIIQSAVEPVPHVEEHFSESDEGEDNEEEYVEYVEFVEYSDYVEEPQPVVETPPVVEEASAVVEETPPVEEAPAVVEETPPVEEETPPVVEETPPVEEETHAVVTPVVVETPSVNSIPKLVFIVPYRDREQQYMFFKKHMEMVLEDMDKNDYKIYYIHQKDDRDFNRGAMKNIGFLIIKEKYPNDYKNITLVFNDIDNMPFTKNFLNYDTIHGEVKHFYGFTHTLGGIVSIKAGDFEKIKGFPNFWAWGYEDNLLKKRVLDEKFKINYDQFYPFMDKNILVLHSGINRTVNRREFDRYITNTKEGFHFIQNLIYKIDESTGMVDVNQFTTEVGPAVQLNKEHDIRNGSRPFVARRIGNMKMFF